MVAMVALAAVLVDMVLAKSTTQNPLFYSFFCFFGGLGEGKRRRKSKKLKRVSRRRRHESFKTPPPRATKSTTVTKPDSLEKYEGCFSRDGPRRGQEDHLRIQITHDHATTNLLWSAAGAKAAWFQQNHWASKLSRMAKFGITPTEAEHFQQFVGLSGEAAVWQWLWGDLEEFWEQQAELHESQTRTDGGQDLQGIDVKTRDLMHHSSDNLPDLLITPSRLKSHVHYLLAVACLSEPWRPQETVVVLCGAISGQAIHQQQRRWYSEKLRNLVIPQSDLAPITTLRWPEHPANSRGK